MIKKFFAVVYSVLALALLIPQIVLADTRVVTTIKPVHSLTASIMDGVGEPVLIIEGIESPHDYQPKPSDAKLLEEADVVVWIGPDLESAISTAIMNLSKNAISVELSKTEGLKLYEFRSSHVHHDEEEHMDEHDEDHDHEHGDEHDEEHGDEHGDEHDEDHDHEHDDGHDDEHGDEHGDEHDHHAHEEGAVDVHVWLDVSNSMLMADEIAQALKVAYPQHNDQFESNLKALQEKLHGLEHELEAQAESIKDLPYIVFHDAYQYLEKWLGLESVAAVHLNPTITPGVGQINEVREAVVETGAICAFAEPQFNPGVLKTVAEGTDIKMGMIDPLGQGVEPGPNAYFELMRNIVTALRDCLT